MPAPKPKTLDDVAALLKPDRTAFAEVYDRGRPAGSPDFKTLAIQRPRPVGETEEQRTRRDMLLALERARADGWLVHFTPANLGGLSDDPQVVIALQAITNPEVDFDHIGDVSDGVLKAMRRCCRIVCGDDGNAMKGSGFLIGPQLVLTNWHVVRTQIEADLAAQQAGKPTPPTKVWVEFDSFRNRDGSVTPAVVERVAERWLVTSCPDGDEKAPTAIGVQRTLPLDRTLLKERIDFAVIELANPVGYERGWYELDANLPAPKPDAQGQLVQFPGNYAMRVTAGPYLKKPELPGRVSHSMNTIEGSSGGLCATTTYVPLALHQGALRLRNVRDEVENQTLLMGVRNVAIPLGLIAQMAGEAISLRAREAPALLHQAAGGLPIVGRQALQRAIHDAIYGVTRLIVVRNSYDPETGHLKTGVGKSFTVKIVEAMARSAEHLIRVVSAADLPADAYGAATALAAPFRDATASAPVVTAYDALASAAPAGDTTQDADVRSLADTLLTALRLAAGERTLWLVIDDLDKHPVASTSQTANLLNLLYSSISAEPRLRAMLIGPTAALPLLDALKARSEGPLLELTAPEIEQWMRLARGRDRPLAPEYVTMLQGFVVAALPNWRPQEGLSRTARIADILKTMIGPQLA